MSNKSNPTIDFLKSHYGKLQEMHCILNDFDITSFSYAQIYTEHMIYLNSNLEWMHYYINKEIFSRDRNRIHAEASQAKDNGIYFLFRDAEAVIPLTLEMNKHDIKNIFTIQRLDLNYVEFFGFMTDMKAENKISFYLNNKDFLIRFAYLFKDKMLNEIKNSAANLMFHLGKSDSIAQNIKKKDILQKINPKKIHLREDIILSRQEYSCLFHLNSGCTYKQIAETLNLSPRTVEAYINNVKYKIGCNYKGDIIEAINKLSPISLINL